MSRMTAKAYDVVRGFPRVSGDEPSGYSVPPNLCAFSPRERG